MKYPYVKRLPSFQYVAPKTMAEALIFLSEHDGEAKPMAGGTDLLLNMKRREVVPRYLVGLKNIGGLDQIDYDNGHGLRMGPLVTIHDVETSPTVREKFPILARAASTLGSVQIRNLGTVVGNVCSALPSGDMIPSLIVLGAKIKILDKTHERWMSVEDLFTGVGKTVLGPHELAGEIQVPGPSPGSGGTYIKYAQRGAKALGVCNVATFVTVGEEDTCTDVKICLGAVGETPIRAREAEAVLKGKPFSPEWVKKAAATASKEARPRSSHLRGSAEYRKEMVAVLTERALNSARDQVR